VIAYRATLDVPRELAQYLSRLLHAERRRRGTRKNSRALTCFGQAVLGLRWFRQGVEVAALARDHEVSRATGYRYLDEVIEVLADQAPDLQIDLWYSGKAHEHGGNTYAAPSALAFSRTSCNVQAVSEPDGFPLWVADVEPGSIHDLTVAREHVLGALYWAASHLDLPTLADGGYDGAGIGVHTPIKQPASDQVLDVDTRTYNTLLRGLRRLGERGFALLTGRWRTLHHTTASPSKIGHIVKAALVLTHFEHGRLT
jgi:hypothetical protein